MHVRVSVCGRARYKSKLRQTCFPLRFRPSMDAVLRSVRHHCIARRSVSKAHAAVTVAQKSAPGVHVPAAMGARHHNHQHGAGSSLSERREGSSFCTAVTSSLKSETHW